MSHLVDGEGVDIEVGLGIGQPKTVGTFRVDVGQAHAAHTNRSRNAYSQRIIRRRSRTVCAPVEVIDIE